MAWAKPISQRGLQGDPLAGTGRCWLLAGGSYDAPMGPTDALSPAERQALFWADLVNHSPRLKSAAQWLNIHLSAPWMRFVSEARMHLDGIDRLAALRPDRGVLFASNHRSFFDMYMLATYVHLHTDLIERLYFPVRSEFFYERPLGVAVNVAMSFLSMYPPVFRAPEKRAVTRRGLDFLAAELRRPGTVVGMHPEGTRGKGPDPYELLPPEPGFGRVVLEAQPIVIPVFVHGLGNDLWRECTSTILRNGPPIFIVFGGPLDLHELAGCDPHRLRHQAEVGRHVMEAIARLAERERGLRAALSAQG